MIPTLEIFPGIMPVSGKFEGLLLDAYGVFWGGNAYGLFPGAKEVMSALVTQGKIVGILSNSTQLAAQEIEKVHQHGLIQGKHFHFFITSGEIGRSIFLKAELPFLTPRNTFWLLGNGSGHEAIFKDTTYCQRASIDEADFIYISIPKIQGEDQIDPELFRKEVAKIKAKNLPMVCPNPDQFAHEGNPVRAVVRQGSIAKIYEELGGQVFYIGKPYRKAYQMALKRFLAYGLTDPQKLLMVGDTPETDVRGAKLAGMSSALMTQTGIMAERISKFGQEIAYKNLPIQDFPTYFVERFV